ncbi:hypothetical protein ACLB2K_016879 [Fragaria x ananassa]
MLVSKERPARDYYGFKASHWPRRRKHLIAHLESTMTRFVEVVKVVYEASERHIFETEDQDERIVEEAEIVKNRLGVLHAALAAALVAVEELKM